MMETGDASTPIAKLNAFGASTSSSSVDSSSKRAVIVVALFSLSWFLGLALLVTGSVRFGAFDTSSISLENVINLANEPSSSPPPLYVDSSDQSTSSPASTFSSLHLISSSQQAHMNHINQSTPLRDPRKGKEQQLIQKERKEQPQQQDPPSPPLPPPEPLSKPTNNNNNNNNNNAGPLSAYRQKSRKAPRTWNPHEHFGKKEPLYDEDDFSMERPRMKLSSFTFTTNSVFTGKDHGNNGYGGSGENNSGNNNNNRICNHDILDETETAHSAPEGLLHALINVVEVAPLSIDAVATRTNTPKTDQKEELLLSSSASSHNLSNSRVHLARNVSLAAIDRSVVGQPYQPPPADFPSDTKWKFDSRWNRAPATSPHEDYRNIKIRFGILAVAKLVNTRLLPMLNTSLRDATMVDVFIKKTAVSASVVEYIRRSVRTFHPHWEGIRVFELYGPPTHLAKSNMAYRNAWQNLEIIRLWRAEAETDEIAVFNENDVNRQLWYSILDDDTFVFVDSAKAMIQDIERYYIKNKFPKEVEKETKNESAPLVLPRDINERHSYLGKIKMPGMIAGLRYFYEYNRRVLNDRRNAFLLPPKYERKLANFIFGGTGYFFNRAAMAPLNNTYIDFCRELFNFKAGDAIATICLQEASDSAEEGSTNSSTIKTEIFNVPHMVNGPFWECTKPKSLCHRSAPFPISSHRFTTQFPRGLSDAYAARAIYDMRKARGELVHWDDIRKNILPATD